ncbi:girdin isoform X3 [Hydra vulgaris]|uniref:girdin isoform X3 n=1 Tax=Hydra vulgaris TaxID=6087 RepID=UPI0032EA0D07
MDKVYQPEHPLPDSIKNMSRCETVCQFCGISYLIHSEIKMLQSELKEHKREIERLKEFDAREVLLKNDISRLNLQYQELTFEYEATKKIDHQKSLFIIEKESEILLFNEKLLSFSTTINEASLNLSNVKHQVICDLLILQELLKKIKNVFCIIMVEFKNFQKEFSELLEEFKLKVMIELRKNFDIITNLKITIEKIENEEKKKNVLEQLKVLFHTNKVLQEAFDTLKLENDTLKAENGTLKLEKNTLKIENEHLKLEKNTLKIENENKKNSQEEFNTLKVENETLKVENETLKVENETLKVENETLKVENETLKVENETLKIENETLKIENDVQRAERGKLILAGQNKVNQMQEYLDEKMLDSKKLQEEMKQQVQSLLMESKHEKQRHAEQLSFQENLKIEMDNQHKQIINDLSECFLKRELKLKSEMDLMQSKCHEKVKMLIVKSEVAQIKLLQNCVKRECEERFELTETLAKTKEELLSMQINFSTSSGLLKTKKANNVGTEANNIEKRDHIIINTGERISKLNENEARKRCINKDEFDKAKFVISLRNSFRR